MSEKKTNKEKACAELMDITTKRGATCIEFRADTLEVEFKDECEVEYLFWLDLIMLCIKYPKITYSVGASDDTVLITVWLGKVLD